MKSFFIVFLFLCFIFSSFANAVYVRDLPTTIQQPDGTEIACFVTGDEFYHWVHDQEGYTIVQDPVTGYCCYAELQDGNIVASRYIVGEVRPAEVGLVKHVRLPAQQILAKKQARLEKSKRIVRKSRLDEMQNLVIFIRFADEAEFTDTIDIYEDMFNDDTPNTNSLRNYYLEVSYGQFTISSTFYPTPGATVLSYQDPQPRGYYQKYNATTNPIGYKNDDEYTERLQTLLKDAVNAVKAQVPPGLNIDFDNDGYVDNLCFIAYGKQDAWADLLWPHQWELFMYDVFINGKQVLTYNFQLQKFLANSGYSVLMHEAFHSLGAPDLYRYYDGTIDPVYQWDIMCWDVEPAQHMCAFMKYRYGLWIDQIPLIQAVGRYTLNPITSPTGNCYKIALSDTEYIVLEYRQKIGTNFESALPGSGIIIYRIDTKQDGLGNADGPPDEVYVYRPGGSNTVNGSPRLAHFSDKVGRTKFDITTNPYPFTSDNRKIAIAIFDIVEASNSISFSYYALTIISYEASGGGSCGSTGIEIVLLLALLFSAKKLGLRK